MRANEGNRACEGIVLPLLVIGAAACVLLGFALGVMVRP